ncbi:MAG: hypothetical protein K8U57_04680 [Planctomycetes bacterium]|nr:hypothetical protein [Planctomycetota bacterium]
MTRSVGVPGMESKRVRDGADGVGRNTGGTGDPTSAKSVASEAKVIGADCVGGISETPQSQPAAPQS